MVTGNDETASSRNRILDVALGLVQAGGPEAITIRAVATAASVQPPTIYRLFGDKQALLDAVVEHGIAAYVATKAAHISASDPVEAMRESWDNHVAFGLANPGLFSIMSANPGSPAAAKGLRLYREIVRKAAKAGRLRTSEERAVSMVRAGCVGVVMTLLADDKHNSDDVSHATREAIISAVTQNALPQEVAAQPTAAATLRANLDKTVLLTYGEKALLDELLFRLSNDDL
ncbi:TetR/AcrR family transcriptional regulator [Klebsiella variicola]|uniref:TetR/AcrR family transcriptional regulator n=1 Tax=Klebsiella variicola TaxID=244366 RepID=UPI0015E9F62A|nr:TetR/AcrR family transcriptional regulator [Klebsiella variicola]QLS59446.1 TetR/AcrR family transcriptional regulator [Klebsiella variicola]